VIERLRTHPHIASLPVLVLSALSSTSARIRGLRDGADDYMIKPFLPEELVARTRTLVTSRLLERRTRELAALGRIAQASLSASSPDALLSTIVEVAAEVFDADAAAILLVEEGRSVLHARASIGFNAPLATLAMPRDVGVAHVALSSQSPVIIPDGAATDRQVTNVFLRDQRFRALMVAPLIVAGTPIGILEVGRRSRRIDPRADRLLRIVADRAAVAIEYARLEGEARHLADVVRRIGEGVAVVDAEDRVIFANRAFLEMVAVSGESLRGRPWTDFLSTAQNVPALTAQMRQSSFHGEILLITNAGEPRPVLVTMSTVEDGNGLQRIGVFRDISREHELRFRVIREQKFRTLGSLAAGVAHNINNRLTPVLGWTEMLIERLRAGEVVDPEELTHALTVIHQGASDGVETVRRLQEYSRPARVRGHAGSGRGCGNSASGPARAACGTGRHAAGRA